MAKKSVKPALRATSAKAVAKKGASTKKSSVQRRPSMAITKPPSLKPAPPKRFRFHKPIKHPVKLPSVWELSKTTALILWQHKRLFIGITILYALLTLILVQGVIGSSDTASLKSALNHASKGNLGGVTAGFNALVIGSSGSSSSPTAGPYQLALALITSLAIIWTLRQILSGTKKIRLRDAYYQGMYPLIPFILILLLICVQLLPFIIGGVIYGTVISTGIAAHFIESAFWLALFVVLALWSLYMISASIFALYIVTLPDMTPIKALRSAQELVRHRRWTVLRKLLCLPLILLIVVAVIMLPIILVLTPITQWVFFLLSMASLVPLLAYIYILYRKLLNE